MQEKHKRCIILPQNKWKVKFDLWVIFVLITTAVILPFQIAFVEKPGTAWKIVNYTIDISFLIDMLLTFFTAINDPETNMLICDKKAIAKTYLSGWFIIDVISILPIDLMINTEGTAGNKAMMQMAKMSRLSRISKFIRLVRIIRMAKMLRICKDRKRISA